MGRPRRAPGEGQVNWSAAHGSYVAVLTIKRPDGSTGYRTRMTPIKGKTRAAYKDAEEKLSDLKTELAAETRAAEDATSRAHDTQTYTLWSCIEDWHRFAPTTGKTSQWTADKLRDSCRRWVHPDVAAEKRDKGLLLYLRRVGDTPLAEVDSALLAEHMRAIAPHLGRAGLGDVLNTVRRAIRLHMQQRGPLVDRNVADGVDLPKPGKLASDPVFLTKDEVDKVFAVAGDTRMYALVCLGFQLGLRPGEIRALRWEHVDLTKRQVSIVSYARRTGDGRTKTATSRRVLPLPPRSFEALQEHQERWGEHDYVFTAEGGNGAQLTKEGLSWRVGVVFRDAGLSVGRDPYAMRHTFASLADDAGMPHRKIADVMGHKDITTFQKVYRHKLSPEVTDVGDALSQMWA